MHDYLHFMPRGWGYAAHVQPALPAMLRTFVHIRTAPAKAAGSLDGGDCTPAAHTWPGKDIGVREPIPGETQLSASEIGFGYYNNLFLELK